ncbi:hypothetical protein EDB86DRAFT_1352349 [Lactarius hatsudake]|nr:hypothetical protein EDB86DRAFT_1352349 [Lactarius hatsudake]
MLAAGAGTGRGAAKGKKEGGAPCCSVPKAGAARASPSTTQLHPHRHRRRRSHLHLYVLSHLNRALVSRLSFLSTSTPTLVQNERRGPLSGNRRLHSDSSIAREPWRLCARPKSGRLRISHWATLTCVCGVGAVARRNSDSDSDFEHECMSTDSISLMQSLVQGSLTKGLYCCYDVQFLSIRTRSAARVIGNQALRCCGCHLDEYRRGFVVQIDTELGTRSHLAQHPASWKVPPVPAAVANRERGRGDHFGAVTVRAHDDPSPTPSPPAQRVEP